MTNLPAPSAREDSPELIGQALQKVLASKIFDSSPQMSRLLRHLVSQTLDGNFGGLKEYPIGLEVFGRGRNYDPRMDPVVRVEARRLRAKLAEYYLTEGREDETVITIPKGGYVARFERLPVFVSTAAPLNAQASEPPDELFLPESNAPTVPAASTASHVTVPLLRRRPALLLACSLMVAVAIGWALFPLRTRGDTTLSMAVLPFVNQSADPGNRYFSDGLTDEITDELSRFKGVRIVARSSARQVSRDKEDISEIGRKLHVSTVLEGSVERYGERIRISAELERVSDGSRLWSSTYEGRIADLLAVQSEVAGGIATSLRASITPPSHAEHIVHDEEAHNYYLKARYEEQSMSSDGLSRAAADYQRAIERDPAYGQAYVHLGNVLFNQGAAVFLPAQRQRIERLWRKAIEVDPTLGSPHEGLGLLAIQYDWDWPRARSELETALSLGPNASAQMDEAYLAVIHHRFSEADDHLRRAQDLDPLGPATLFNTGVIRTLEGRFAPAQQEFETLTARNPGFTASAVMLNGLYIYEGHPDRAIEGLQKLERYMPGVRVLEAVARARSGKRQDALNLIRPFEQNYAAGGVPMYWFALAYASLGDEAMTVQWLNRSADAREFQALYTPVEPIFEAMRKSAGFLALEKRMGLT